MGRKNIQLFILLTFFLATFLIWRGVFAQDRSDNLIVAFLDVDQGDAIFIETPSGNQVLIDGGPDARVERELSALMSPYDRTIDIVLATHPDSDHIGGLVGVLDQFDVEMVVDTGSKGDSPAARAYGNAVALEDSIYIRAEQGMVIDLGDSVFLTILFPDRNLSHISGNDVSIVARLEYGETSVLLTGDADKAIEEYLLSLGDENLSSDIFKVGHHGSKTSSSESFVGMSQARYGIVSVGCDNRYGHPHQEVLDTLTRFEVEVLSTCEHGTILFESDGKEIVLQK